MPPRGRRDSHHRTPPSRLQMIPSAAEREGLKHSRASPAALSMREDPHGPTRSRSSAIHSRSGRRASDGDAIRSGSCATFARLLAVSSPIRTLDQSVLSRADDDEVRLAFLAAIGDYGSRAFPRVPRSDHCQAGPRVSSCSTMSARSASFVASFHMERRNSRAGYLCNGREGSTTDNTCTQHARLSCNQLGCSIALPWSLRTPSVATRMTGRSDVRASRILACDSSAGNGVHVSLSVTAV
jgi:hypothetical protein